MLKKALIFRLPCLKLIVSSVGEKEALVMILESKSLLESFGVIKTGSAHCSVLV